MSTVKRAALIPLFLGISACAEPASYLASPTGAVAAQLPSFKPGDTWKYRNYQVRSGALNRTWVETVQAVNAQGIIVQRVDRIPPNDTVVRQKPEVRKFGEDTLRARLTVGTSWREPIVEDGVRIGETACLVTGRQLISVRAGKFDTMTIDCRYSRSSEKFHTVTWYSPSARNVVLHYFLRDGKPEQATELTSLKLR